MHRVRAQTGQHASRHGMRRGHAVRMPREVRMRMRVMVPRVGHRTRTGPRRGRRSGARTRRPRKHHDLVVLAARLFLDANLASVYPRCSVPQRRSIVPELRRAADSGGAISRVPPSRVSPSRDAPCLAFPFLFPRPPVVSFSPPSRAPVSPVRAAPPAPSPA